MLSQVGERIQTALLTIVLASLVGCREEDLTSRAIAEAEHERANAGAVDIKGGVAEQPEQGERPLSDSELRDAAENGDLQTVEHAIQQRVDVNSPNENGSTSLMLSAFNGHTEIVRVLLANKARVNARDVNARTALMYAASGPYVETVQLLVNNGAEVNASDNGESWDALMFAAAEGQLEVAKVLLAHGADPTRTDTDGETALDFATNKGHREVAELLSPQ